MQVPAFLDGDSPKRLFQGLAVGVISTIAIGFIWGGWNLSSTVDEKVNTAAKSATVAALAPICADRFEIAAKTNKDMFVAFKAVDSWQRDDHLKKAGWVTFAGGEKPNNDVADACAKLLVKFIEQAKKT